jgi:hypothetical protein
MRSDHSRLSVSSSYFEMMEYPHDGVPASGLD